MSGAGNWTGGGFHSSFKFISPDAVEELREWLKANCEGEFTIKIPDMEVTAQRGQFRVQFERESDVIKLGKMLGVTARKTITFLMVSIILVFLMSFLALAGSGFLAMALG